MSDFGFTQAAGIATAAISGASASAAGIKNRKEIRRYRREDRANALADYEMQKADNVAFWNMENEYNSPDAQRRRLEEAGYNPALALGDVNSVGEAGDVNSPDAARGATIAPYEMPTNMFDGMVSSAVKAASSMEAIRGQRLDNDLKSEALPWDAKKRRNESNATDYLERQAEISLTLDEARVEYTGQLTRVKPSGGR